MTTVTETTDITATAAPSVETESVSMVTSRVTAGPSLEMDTSPVTAAPPSSTLMDQLSTNIRSFSYNETTQKEMRPFSRYDTNTRSSDFIIQTR